MNTTTIDTKVGEQFEIREKIAVHLDGKLTYPKDAFDLISETEEPLPTRRGIPAIGAKPTQVYRLEALAEGTYTIEYTITSFVNLNDSPTVHEYTVNVAEE